MHQHSKHYRLNRILGEASIESAFRSSEAYYWLFTLGLLDNFINSVLSEWLYKSEKNKELAKELQASEFMEKLAEWL